MRVVCFIGMQVAIRGTSYTTLQRFGAIVVWTVSSITLLLMTVCGKLVFEGNQLFFQFGNRSSILSCASGVCCLQRNGVKLLAVGTSASLVNFPHLIISVQNSISCTLMTFLLITTCFCATYQYWYYRRYNLFLQVGTASTNALTKLRSKFDKNFEGKSEDVPILATSLAYGVYMSVSSNLR
jgi:hypothetical protein